MHPPESVDFHRMKTRTTLAMHCAGKQLPELNHIWTESGHRPEGLSRSVKDVQECPGCPGVSMISRSVQDVQECPRCP